MKNVTCSGIKHLPIIVFKYKIKHVLKKKNPGYVSEFLTYIR